MARSKTNTTGLRLPFGAADAITEQLLHFIWAFGYFNTSGLTTVEGEPLTIVHCGHYNKNQGPDFTAAKIKIGETLLAGTVELHLKTSDWRRHRHQGDGNYKNVVLHAVWEHDEGVNEVPVLELSPRVPALLLQQYAYWMENSAFIPCEAAIGGVKEITLAAWKERLLVERFTRKANGVLQLLAAANHHWDETFWWLLCRNIGGTINADAFEAVARSIPLTLLAKHKASIHQLEALLFGQANLLTETFPDPYPQLLQREYRFLQKKYKLQPSPLPVHFLRMRPGSFPTLRLAQLAVIVQQTNHLFSQVLEAADWQSLGAQFNVTANDYWHYHYTFQQASAYKKKTVGADAVNGLLINTVSPVLFAYGLYHNKAPLKEKALAWLQALPAESNGITRAFTGLGLQNKSAYDSQALLELKHQFCTPRRCLECAVGNAILKEAAHPYTRQL